MMLMNWIDIHLSSSSLKYLFFRLLQSHRCMRLQTQLTGEWATKYTMQSLVRWSLSHKRTHSSPSQFTCAGIFHAGTRRQSIYWLHRRICAMRVCIAAWDYRCLTRIQDSSFTVLHVCLWDRTDDMHVLLMPLLPVLMMMMMKWSFTNIIYDWYFQQIVFHRPPNTHMHTNPRTH